MDEDELCEAFATALRSEARVARDTVRCYRDDALRFAAWLRVHGGQLRTASAETLAAYVAEARGRGENHRTIARRLAAIGRILRWLVETGRRASLAPSVSGLVPPRSRTTLSRRQLDASRAAVATIEAILRVGAAPADARDLAVVRLLAGAGVSLRDVVRLRVVDVDVAGGTLRVHAACRAVSSDVIEALRRWLAKRPLRRARDDLYVFPAQGRHDAGITRQALWKALHLRAGAAGIDRRALTPRRLMAIARDDALASAPPTPRKRRWRTFPIAAVATAVDGATG